MNDTLKFSILIIIGIMSFTAFLGLSLRDNNIEKFVEVSEKYQRAYDEFEPTVYLPGSGSNKTRQIVNNLLSNALMGQMEDSDRYVLSQDALKHLLELDRQIAEITSIQSVMNEKKEDLYEAATIVHGYKADMHVSTIMDDVDKRALYIEEIGEILAAMNTQTKMIFERIVNEDGRMSDEHISSLNNQLDEAEYQYDRLSFLYNELNHIKSNLENEFFEVRVLMNK